MKLQIFTIKVKNFNFKARVFTHRYGGDEESSKIVIQRAFEKYFITFEEKEMPLLHDFLSRHLVNYVWFEVEKNVINKEQFAGLMSDNSYQIYFDKEILVK